VYAADAKKAELGVQKLLEAIQWGTEPEPRIPLILGHIEAVK
jgi:hypothetical protein